MLATRASSGEGSSITITCIKGIRSSGPSIDAVRTMQLNILAGDVLDTPADVLISTANPWLQMTGGVNLQIILRPQGEHIHEELQAHLRAAGGRFVEPGTVVRTGPGSLPFKHILHAVAI